MKLIFKGLLAISLISSISFGLTLHKINEGYIKGTSLNKNTQKKLKLQEYNVKYNKIVSSLSIMPHNKQAYKNFIKVLGINDFTLGKIFGKTTSKISILLSALGYDWVYKRPDLAENFYRIMEKNINQYSLRDKLKLADYYLRTGRPGKIAGIISRPDCMGSFKYNSQCFYYLGVENYLLTGNNRNFALGIARNSIKKAREIYMK